MRQEKIIIQHIKDSSLLDIYNVFDCDTPFYVVSYYISGGTLQKILKDYKQDITFDKNEFKEHHLFLIENIDSLFFDCDFTIKNKLNKVYKYYGEEIKPNKNFIF
jgi:serine/threonine protein kinase